MTGLKKSTCRHWYGNLFQLLFKSAAVQGFLLPAYFECFPSYFKHLAELLENQKLKPIVDNGQKTTGAEFFGMEGIIKGVEVRKENFIFKTLNSRV